MSVGSTIAFIAQNAYGALCGGGGHVGGAELQVAQMARFLAAKGYRVGLITWDEGQRDGEIVNDVTVYKMCRRKSGIPGFRFVHPRLTSLYQAMRRADAKVYYHNSAEYVTGLAALWCRRWRRRLVYSVAAELACDFKLPLMDKCYERLLYRYGVRNADLRIVQTQRQAQLLSDGWGLSSVVLPMPCLTGPRFRSELNKPQSPGTVLWVGRVDPNKRLEWLLDVAERSSSIRFEVAAATNESTSYAAAILDRAQRIPNVRWHGTVSRDMMPDLYEGADLLCCTSLHEGFPNTFLEAWNHGLPVVSTFDPDHVIRRMKLGLVAGNREDLANALNTLLMDRQGWRECSQNATAYFDLNHKPDVAVERFESAIFDLIRGGAATEVSL